MKTTTNTFHLVHEPKVIKFNLLLKFLNTVDFLKYKMVVSFLSSFGGRELKLEMILQLNLYIIRKFSARRLYIIYFTVSI